MCDFIVWLNGDSNADGEKLETILMETSKNGTLNGFKIKKITSTEVKASNPPPTKEAEESAIKDKLPEWAFATMISLGAGFIIVFIVLVVVSISTINFWINTLFPKW